MKSTDSTTRSGETLPLVPLRDMVVFPHMMAPFVVGRDSSIRALEAALATPGKRLFLSAQKDPQLDEPRPEDIHGMGVVATVAQSLKLPNGHIKVMVEGARRGRIVSFDERAGYLAVAVEPVASRPVDVEELKEYMGKVLGLFEQYAKLSHHLAFEGLAASLKIDDPDRFADTLAAHIAVSTPEKSAEQKIRNEMTTSKMASVTAVIFYAGTARLAARSQPRDAGGLVSREKWCVLVCSLSEPRAN